MNTRDRLITLREKLDGDEDNIGDVELLDKLIAERPYEPGEEVQGRRHVVEPWTSVIFQRVCGNGYYLVHFPPTKDFAGGYFHLHRENIRPLPKSYRVTVPEEVIDKARQITASRIDDVVAANEVCNWLANPENWEAGNE